VVLGGRLLAVRLQLNANQQSTFEAAPPRPRQEAPIEPPKAETKQDAAPVPNNVDIQSAIHASDEARELLDRRRYILDAGSDKDNAR